MAELDLAAEGISTIIWAGLSARLRLDRLPGDRREGSPAPAGVTEIPGLCFLGPLWQRNQASATLFGVGLDGAHRRADGPADPRGRAGSGVVTADCRCAKVRSVTVQAGSPPIPRRSSMSTGSSPPTTTGGPTRDPRPAGRVRDVGPPRLGVHRSFNEAHILAMTEAVCRYRARAGHRRAAVHRARHARAVGAGLPDRARGARRERGRRPRRRRRRVHADAGRVARDPRPQPRPARPAWPTASSSRRRTTRPRTAASSTTRRTAARPTPTSPAGSRTRRTGCSRTGLTDVRRVPFERARGAPTVAHDFLDAYVDDLGSVIDMDAIRGSGLRLGVDPLGGASVAYWAAIGERYGLDLTVTNDAVDPTFGFMTVDWDGRIRMDPSSPYAMARLVELRDRFDIAFGNDADADRHGIVTPGAGLMNPNHFLSAAIAYLFGGGRDWASRRRGRQDARVERDDRPGRRRPRPARCSRCRSASSGSSPGCSTARSGSAARRAPARRSCGATAPSGRPTRTGSSPACSPPR